MKDFFIIEGLGGKKRLKGSIAVRGAKNAALPAMASSLLFGDPVEFRNVPHIEDVVRMAELIEGLGGKAERLDRHIWKIDARAAAATVLPAEISKRMRASIILAGPLLARFGEASFPHPGGCVIGARPINFFLEGFRKMGVVDEVKGDTYHLSTKGKKLRGADIFFSTPTVTGTETLMMAATLAEGKTTLRNAAMEPEVKSLADFLSECGAAITGAGTPTIEIVGGKVLSSRGKKYVTPPDRIEAGSLLILGALAAEELEITDCIPEDIGVVIEILRRSGVPIETGKRTVALRGNGAIKNAEFRSADIRTHEYPGFPTDLQAPMTVFLTQASGESRVFETVFEGRLNYTSDLVKMGASITMWNAHEIGVKGPTLLSGRELDGPDIRAGLAYVIAAVVAKGNSAINNVRVIDRGYEQIEGRLEAIGVDIERVSN